MSDNYELVGSIRSALLAISDHYDMALIPAKMTAGVKLPTAPSPDSHMKYAGKVYAESPAPTNLDVIETRRRTHADLLHYTRVIQFEVTDIDGGTIATRIDGGNVDELCDFIGRWADRLATECPAEAERAASDLAAHGRKLKGHALPNKRDWMPVGDCPVTVADADGNSVQCGAKVRAYTDKQFIQCPECGTEDTLAWWMSQIVPEGSDTATATQVIAYVAMRGSLILHHDQIRKWASLGHIQRHGKDVKGRTLYSSSAVLAYAQDRVKEEVA